MSPSTPQSCRDKPDSPSRPAWRKAAPIAADDRGGPRKHGGPSSPLHNGREDPEEPRGQPSPGGLRADHPSTGPASRAAQGSSSSIPYIDCSDIDSEYDVAKGRVTSSRPHANDNDEDEPPLASRRAANGGYRRQLQYERDRVVPALKPRYGESPPFSAPPLALADDEASVAFVYGAGHPLGPLHSTLVDEAFRGLAQRSPLVARQVACSRSSGPSPILSSFHRTSSLSYGDHNGHGGAGRRHGDEGRRYGSYSPIVARSPRLHKLQGARNRSDTDPLILSQLTSTPAPRPQAPPLERYAAAATNGSAPSQRPYGRAGGVEHAGGVQMIDGSTSSGTESSDSESETTGSSCGLALVYGNPGADGASPHLPRNKFSFGSLQLDEETEEDGDGGFNFSDEDGPRLFSC